MAVLAHVDRQAVLEVARAHGTTIAAEWSGRSTASVRVLRQRVDGYDRGRGHPSAAEIAARATRRDCPCPRCVEYYAPARAETWSDRVAAAAQVALDAGDRLPGEAVADRMCVTVDMAHALLRDARRDGLIPTTIRVRALR